ncbi:MAG: ABC transporter permease [Spirochaeta sp.]|jgi:simple sugar transport system permease protein|nr:ABC transporter permease [Spirochaeta sp.]
MSAQAQYSDGAAVGREKGAKAKRFAIRYGFLIVMGLSFLFFGLVQPVFWRPANLFSILLGVTVYGILALGVTFPLVIDGLDLSIGSVAALSVMISAYLMVVLEMSGIVAILVSLGLGAFIGAINGFLIVKVKIPDLLATLGMMFLVQGLQLIPSGGRSIGRGAVLQGGITAQGQFAEYFLFLGQGKIFGIVPTAVAIMIIVAVLVFVVLSLTRWGRVFYAIGSNSEAARLVGAKVDTYRMMAYVISGTIAGLAGIVLAARIGRGDVQSGGTLLLDAIGSALIGFAVLGVRRPNPFGTIVGAIFIGMLLNGLTMLNMPYFVQDFIKGVVLVAALAFTFGLSKAKT